MSVFASHPKTNHVRNAVIVMALCVIITGAVLAVQAIRVPLTAAIREALGTPTIEPTASPEETVFPQPRDVDWDGVVFAVLGGGNGFAVRRVSTGEMFQAYLPEGQTSSVSYQPVRIRGRWTGISCAYRQTLFNNVCTPTVDIDALEILPIMFE